MEPIIPTEIYWLIAAVMGVVEFIKMPFVNVVMSIFPKIKEDGAKLTLKVLTFALAIGGVFLFMECETRLLLQYGVLIGLGATGLYQIAKPVGAKIINLKNGVVNHE